MQTIIQRIITSIAATLFTLGTAVAFANDGQYVTGTSLAVKERLKSLEQINVTAEKEMLEIESESAAVRQLLEELEALDTQDASPSDAQ